MKNIRQNIRKFLIREMKGYKLYLDDERNPKTPGPWVVVRSYDDFVSTIEKLGLPSYISFDNDLGENKPEGYDCAKWLVNVKKFDLRNVEINVHSANPNAPDNIYKLINNWNKMVEKFGNDYSPDVEFD